MTYSGGVKLIEQILSATLVCLLLFGGQQTKTYFLFGVAAFSLVLAGILTLIHVFTSLERTFSPLYWIEFGFSLSLGFLFLLASTVVWTLNTQWYIIVSVIGYGTSVVFFVDTINQFQLAKSPRARYVWSVPNMPT
ncbi:uncharacterized protein LOC109602519 isoform X2 [Aethina tumida]|nr:uncharacterized protein LOC109602519 isoform X2 [Aethina tumida]XP_049822007.1 uncharacterized protein LOC109602519 isoform X2 [Aethina tumida]